MSNSFNNSIGTSTSTENLSHIRSGAGLWQSFNDQTDTFGIYNNAGTPEAVIAANIGSIVIDTSNGVLYVKGSDTVNTGWAQVTTSAAAGMTAGSVIFSNGTILTEDNSDLFWDDTDKRLGIGLATPLDTLHISGAMEIDHTAAENDDHAIEIVCDAAGFSDVKAMDIDYISGAVAAGQDEEAIIVNIDETASVGGIVAGYLCLSTTEGSATINGYETGIGINPVVHESGTFGDADNILNVAADVTAALASGGAGAISAFVLDNDTMTIGDAATWDELEVILDTGASGGGIAPTFEYSTGGAGFSSFGPADGTNGFRNTGAILWDSSMLAGWATNASGRYEIRITRTRNSLSTTPIVDEMQISATTEYTWDKDGDLSVRGLALTNDLTVANGGTARSSHTAYAVICGGTTTTAAQQSIASVGSSGDILTSNGAAALPTFQTPASGTIVQSDSTTIGTTANITATIPVDDTIPQITEGGSVMTLAYTALDTANILRIEVIGYSYNASTNGVGALFVQPTANAIGAQFIGTAAIVTPFTVIAEMVAGTVSAQTFEFRIGTQTGVAISVNGIGAANYFSTSGVATMRITEMLP